MTDYRKLCKDLTQELEAWTEFGEQLKELTKIYQDYEIKTRYLIHTAIKELNKSEEPK